jgi:hypothetical protein
MKHLLMLFITIIALASCTSSPAVTPTPDPDTSSLVTDPNSVDAALEVVDLDASAATVLPGTQIRATVLPFGKDRMDAIVSVDRANGSVTLDKSLLSANELEKLKPNTVIVGYASKRVKRGFLRKVTEVTDLGTQLLVKTVPANLKEVFSGGGFRVNRNNVVNKTSKLVTVDGQIVPLHSPRPSGYGSSLSPQGLINFPIVKTICPINVDGDKNTKNDQVCATGTFDLDLDFDLTFQCDGILCTNPYFDTHVTLTESAKFTVEGELTRTVEKTIPIGTAVLGSFPIMVAAIPVVFIAEVDVSLTLEGTVSAKLKYIANQELEISAGVELKDGNFKPYTNFENNITSTDVQYELSASAKATLTGELGVLVYGLGGPTLTAEAWVQFDAAFPRNPLWEISAGLDWSLGVEMEVFGLINLDWKEKLAGLKWDVLFAKNTKPTITVFEPVNGEELRLPRKTDSALAAQAAAPSNDFYVVNFRSRAEDQEEGLNCCTVEWFVDDVLKKTTTAGNGHDPQMRIFGEGEHTIKAVIKDSNGSSRTKSFKINIVSCGSGVTRNGEVVCPIQGLYNTATIPDGIALSPKPILQAK